jgi:hypothetical protein
MNQLCNHVMIRTLAGAFSSLALILSIGAPARAATVAAPSGVVLERNTAGQTLQILVSGPEAVAGMSFSVQIADGGPGSVTQGLIDGPDITNVDLLTGALFGASNEGVDDVGSFPQLARRSVLTQGDVTLPLSGGSGVLATITLTTVGVAPGTYALILGGTPEALSSTEFYNAAGEPIVPTFINGSVVIVPEPTSLVLACCGVLGAGLVCWRRRQQA